jgi:hypothetical protein
LQKKIKRSGRSGKPYNHPGCTSSDLDKEIRRSAQVPSSRHALNQKRYRLRRDAGFVLLRVPANASILEVLIKAGALKEDDLAYRDRDDAAYGRRLGGLVYEWLARSVAKV